MNNKSHKKDHPHKDDHCDDNDHDHNNGHGHHGNGHGHGHDSHGNGYGYGHDKDDHCVPCYTTGTLIETSTGKRPVEYLEVGDLVMTQDHGPQEILWAGRKDLTAKDISANENLRPIRIKKDALGKNTPSQDLLVSPQHRMLITTPMAEIYFGNNEVFVPAKKLVGLEGIEIAQDVALTSYFHFVTEQHEVVFANDCASETMLTGDMALSTLSDEARAEITALFPETLSANYNAQSARPIIETKTDVQLLKSAITPPKTKKSSCKNCAGCKSYQFG